MKKIINGKMYNTDTAKELFHYWNGNHGFGRISETLYRKKTGEYFLYGVGGARTRYAEKSGGVYYEGCAIIPLSVESAKVWAEKHLDADRYIELFGDVEE